MEPVPETVSELLGITRDLLGDERARGQMLDAKTSTLAGFTGTILAITASLGKDIFDTDLGAVERPLLRVLFVLTIGALAVSALLSVAGVLRPQARLAIDRSELERFGEFPLIATPKMQVEGQLLNATIDAVLHERSLNERKGRLTRRAGARARSASRESDCRRWSSGSRRHDAPRQSSVAPLTLPAHGYLAAPRQKTRRQTPADWIAIRQVPDDTSPRHHCARPDRGCRGPGCRSTHRRRLPRRRRRKPVRDANWCAGPVDNERHRDDRQYADNAPGPGQPARNERTMSAS